MRRSVARGAPGLLGLLVVATALPLFPSLAEEKPPALSLEEQLRTAKAENEKLRAEVQTLRRSVSELQAANAAVRRGAGDVAREAPLRTIEDGLKTLTEEYEQIRTEVAELQKRRDLYFNKTMELNKKLYEAQLEIARLRGDWPATIMSGHVLAVTAAGLLELSIGSDDGVKKGAMFRVIRADGSMYLGQVEVVEVNVHRCVARIRPGTQLGAVNRGDRVKCDLSDGR
jgi:hypothetical protein